MTIDRALLLGVALPLAEAAYDPGAPLPAGLQDVASISAPGYPDFGFVATDGATVFIVLRGTETTDEWLEDFDALSIDAGGFRVHDGFQRVFEALQASIRAAVEGRDAANLCVIGHSLGAAVATLVAASLGAANCIVFASPRVGDKNFAAHCDLKTELLRVVNSRDIVTHVPARPGFCHAGEAVVFDGWNGAPLAKRLDARFQHSLQLSYSPGARGMPLVLERVDLS